MNTRGVIIYLIPPRQNHELPACQLTAGIAARLSVEGAPFLFSGDFPVDSNAIPH